MTDALRYALLAALTAATLAVVGASAWALATLRQPRALVARGQWREAAAAAERLGASWLAFFPGVREEAAYARASCLHLEGRLEESLATLRALGRSARTPADAVALLEGANLVMLGKDPQRAVACLTRACASERRSPEDRVLLALAKHAAGDLTGAEATFRDAPLTRPHGAPSPRIYDPALRYLRGLYLLKTDRPEEAAEDLAAAAQAPLTTLYVTRARALSPPPRRDEGDPRSSLAPQVLDEAADPDGRGA